MRLTPSPDQRRPDPDPLPTNDSAAVLAGIAIWAALLVIALFRHSQLAATGQSWWLWVPVAGIALGLIGLRLIPSRPNRL